MWTIFLQQESVGKKFVQIFMAFSYFSYIKIYYRGFCIVSFPNYLSMKLLIYCGADVDAIDNNLNTPLHYIGKFIIDL